MSSASHRRSRALRGVTTLLALLLSATAFTGDPSLAETSTVTPGTPTGLTSAIEVAQPYIGQSTCDPVAKAGVTAFRDLLLQTYPDTGSLGIVQDCGAPGQSEHKEGRAFDWAVSVNNPQQVAEVKALMTWLLATDSYGNTYAMAKRLGIMYMIWDHQMWRAYSNSEHQADHWDPYTGASGHTDHVHISFGWNGARKATSYWTGVVAPVYTSSTDAGGPATTTTASSANRDVRSRFGQVSLKQGSTGEAVKALQNGLQISADGDFGSMTARAVNAFQSQHGTPVTGAWAPRDWVTMFPLPEDAPPPAASPSSANRQLRSRFGEFSLRQGSTGEAVKALQNGLQISADGDFGPMTARAVNAFQSQHGTPVTGTWGHSDWVTMFPLPEDAPLVISGAVRRVSAYGSTFAITGTAGAGTQVTLHLHPAGRPDADFSILRTVTADAKGAWQWPLTVAGDNSYFATAGGQTTTTVVNVAIPTVDGPLTRVVPRGARVAVTGQAVPGSQVELRLRRADPTPGEFNIVRRATADKAGRWSFSYLARADYSFYVLPAPGADRPSDVTWLIQAR